MKKVIIVVIVLLIAFFLAFFRIDIKSTNKFQFLDSYQTEIGYPDYEAEKILSTDEDEEGLRITFNACKIDTDNIEKFNLISKKIATQVNDNLNSENEFRNIILIFKPKSQDGIKINELISLDELKFKYRASEL